MQPNCALRCATFVSLVALLICMPLGCSSSTDGGGMDANSSSLSNSSGTRRSTGSSNALPSSRTTEIDASGFVLGEVDQAAYTPTAFVQDISSLMSRNRMYSAQRLIQRYPDVAIEVLRQLSGGSADSNAAKLIALTFDQHCSAGSGLGGWVTALDMQANNPSAFGDYYASRRQLLDVMARGDFVGAAEVNPVKTLPADAPFAVKADAWRLRGIGLMVGSRPDHAAEAFRQASQIASGHQLYADIHIKLLHSEAERRAGRFGQATAIWRDAMRAATVLVIKDPPAVDPTFWETAAYLRPTDATWPLEIYEPMIDSLGLTDRSSMMSVLTPDPAEVEAAVWAAVGDLRAGRGESSAAVIAYKKAESLSRDSLLKDYAKYGQARCLIALGRLGTANALVGLLARKSSSPMSLSALGTYGAIELQQGRAPRGVGALEHVFNTEQRWSDWPGRLEAKGDLGLGYIMLGKTELGLSTLHRAQDEMLEAGHIEALLLSLENELRYHEARDNVEEITRLRNRLLRIESGNLRM